MSKRKATKSGTTPAAKPSKVVVTPEAPAKAPKPSKPAKVARAAQPRAVQPAPAQFDEAVALMTQVAAAEGPCAAIRAVATTFPDFKRADVFEVAAHVGINPYTTSRQFQLARKAMK